MIKVTIGLNFVDAKSKYSLTFIIYIYAYFSKNIGVITMKYCSKGLIKKGHIFNCRDFWEILPQNVQDYVT